MKQRRRIYREDREREITPKLIRSLVIVAAQRGFYEAQKNIRLQLREADWRRRYQADLELHGEADGRHPSEA